MTCENSHNHSQFNFSTYNWSLPLITGHCHLQMVNVNFTATNIKYLPCPKSQSPKYHKYFFCMSSVNEVFFLNVDTSLKRLVYHKHQRTTLYAASFPDHTVQNTGREKNSQYCCTVKL